ncbi:MAG TPA: Calx-beta domain-containing protein, partial [Candidatus Acidoferrum sp.]|nr:Calx-beta domain-containing protein [Candidatus Acidoferrum sp.]
MKTFRWFAAGTAVALLSTLALWRNSSPPRPQAPVPAALQPARTPLAQTKAPAPVAKPLAPSTVPGPAFASPAIIAFDQWAQQFVKAGAAQRPALLAQAESLANARREEMVKLIRENPEQAIAHALPYGVRKQLPEGIAALIEQPLSTRGSVRPHINYLLAEHNAENCRVDGLEVEVQQNKKKKKYRAYTYGARLRQPPHESMYLHGISAGDVVALASDAARAITDKEEIADLAAAGKLDLEGKCQSCTQPVAAATASVLEYGEKVYAYCQPSHAGEFNEQLNEAHGMIWAAGAVAGNPPDQLPPGATSGTQGIKKLLYIRITYPDDPRVPQSDDDAYEIVNNNNRFFNLGSYNTVWWEATVTPVIRLPHSKVKYGEDASMVADAWAGAAALGYFRSDYNWSYVLTTDVPQFLFGGRSDGILNGANNAGALSHELGHNLGLNHANFYQPEGRKPGPTNNTPFPTDPDSILIGHNDINAPTAAAGAPPGFLGDPTAEPIYEYGHPYDTMGGGGQFNAYFKRRVLNWLPEKTIHRTTTSTTNRIYGFDVPQITDGRTYAVVTPKVAGTVASSQNWLSEYWLSFRQGVTDNPWFSSGLEIMLIGANLFIDTTPGSAYGRLDGALVVGRTFHDDQVNLHITPIAISNSPEPTNRWIDVVVQIGEFPDNQPPTLSISADPLTITNGGTVTFSSVAQDGNGDTLAYYWDFGDHTFGTNGPVQSKIYTNSGVYVARCEVSDMKGGVASRHVVVTVGTTNLFTISGRVVDPNGNGVQGVRVHNSSPRPTDTNVLLNLREYRYGYTDSDGYYVIGNVPIGSYTLRGFKYGYRTAPQNFTDPLVVTDGETTDFDFLATPITRVRIAETTDAKEPGEDGVTADEEGHFIITREGDISEDLVVRFEPNGELNNTNLFSDAPVDFDLGRIIIPAGLSSIDLRYVPNDNSIGSGNDFVSLRLLLATNDVRVTTVLTNVVTTNGSVSITNTIFLTRTNNLSIPGWELRPSGPNQVLTWFQTDPTYVLGRAEAFVEIIDDDPPGIPNISVTVLDADTLESSGEIAVIEFSRSGAPITNDLVITYGLSGIASNGLDYTGLTGTATIPAGETFTFVYATAVNDLFVEGNEPATVTISPDPLDRYTGAGGSASFLVVDDDLPLVNIFASDSRATRGGGGGRITFSRAGTLAEDLTVNYLVTGTALTGVDFAPLPGSLVIPAGQISVDLPINVIDTSTTPLPRTVTVQISDSTTYNIYSDNAATVTLVDGNLPTVSIMGGGDFSESGGTTSFTVIRTGSTTNSLNVFFEVGGTAWEGIDYSSIGTNVLIPVDAASATITLNGINDSARESGRVLGAETIVIQLRATTNYFLGGTNARSIRITDDDGSALPAVGFLLGTSTVREDAGSVFIWTRVTANPATNRPIEVEYRISGGTAIPNVNYLANSFDRGATGLLHFVNVEDPDPAPIVANSEGSVARIEVPILNDGVSTANRTITLTLMNPTGYQTNVTYVTNNGVPFPSTIITKIVTNAFLGPSLSHTLTILDVGTSDVTITPSSGLAYELGAQPVRFT